MTTDIATWLEKYTVKCRVGRVSKKQCEALRKRPAIRDPKSTVSVGAVVLTRPISCDDCPGWEYFRRKQQSEQQINKIKELADRLEAKHNAEKGKVCSKCKRWKPYTEFHRDRTTRTGYKSRCKVCIKTSRRKSK